MGAAPPPLCHVAAGQCGPAPRARCAATRAGTPGTDEPAWKRRLPCHLPPPAGYLLEAALANALPGRDVVTLLTQVVVDPQDPAFSHPTKHIGPVYSQQVGCCRRLDGWPAGWLAVWPPGSQALTLEAWRPLLAGVLCRGLSCWLGCVCILGRRRRSAWRRRRGGASHRYFHALHGSAASS